MPKPSFIAIHADGSITAIYDDAFVGIANQGECHIERASDVEPTADGKHWTAYMRKDGVTLGPFATRAEALEAEVAYINKQLAEI